MKRHVSGIILMVMAFGGFIFGGFAYFLGIIEGSGGFIGWEFILFIITLAGYSRDDQLNNAKILERELAEITKIKRI